MQQVVMVEDFFCRSLGLFKKKYVLFVDSQNTIHLGMNLTFHNRFKHIDVRYHWIHDVLDAKLFELAKFHTDDNGSILITKVFEGVLLRFGLPFYMEKH